MGKAALLKHERRQRNRGERRVPPGTIASAACLLFSKISPPHRRPAGRARP